MHALWSHGTCQKTVSCRFQKQILKIMIRKTLLCWIILSAPVYAFAQQQCNCEENFNWVKQTFEENDAGFAYALEQKGTEAYRVHNDTILEKIRKTTTKTKCADILHEWLLFFRKAHFSIFPINDEFVTTNTNSPWQTIPITEDQIKKHLINNTSSPFEGIWQTGAYTIGIIKKDYSYNGMILTSSNKSWKPGQVKLTINEDSSGVFYMGNFSPQKFGRAELIGKNTLKLDNFYLERVYPEFHDNDTLELYAKEMSTSVPFIQRLSDKTVLFRIPSFDDSQKQIIDSLIIENDKLLRTTESLIIDIRNNGGGSDISYERIVPLFYTNPIRIVGMELLSTPLNNKRMEGYLSIPGLSENDRKEINSILEILRNNHGKFVNLNNGENVTIQKLDTVYSNPKNIAILINQNNGSTAEQFLLAAKQSKKVKLFGTTTAGVLDISNMYFTESPDKQFRLGYCLSKSLRIPDMAIDGKGIMPDYYIDKSIPDEQWLYFVLNILEQ